MIDRLGLAFGLAIALPLASHAAPICDMQGKCWADAPHQSYHMDPNDPVAKDASTGAAIPVRQPGAQASPSSPMANKVVAFSGCDRRRRSSPWLSRFAKSQPMKNAQFVSARRRGNDDSQGYDR